MVEEEVVQLVGADLALGTLDRAVLARRYGGWGHTGTRSEAGRGGYDYRSRPSAGAHWGSHAGGSGGGRSRSQRDRHGGGNGATSAKPDFYHVLGVDRSASAAQIKKAYHKMALKWHPDKGDSTDEKEVKAREEKFKGIVAAYTALSDDVERAAHDRELARAGRR